MWRLTYACALQGSQLQRAEQPIWGFLQWLDSPSNLVSGKSVGYVQGRAERLKVLCRR